MSDSDSHEISASTPNHPDAKRVDEHLVIDKTQWCPGSHPDPNRGHEGQNEYLERYLRCVLCGIEVLNERDLPSGCDGDAR